MYWFISNILLPVETVLHDETQSRQAKLATGQTRAELSTWERKMLSPVPTVSKGKGGEAGDGRCGVGGNQITLPSPRKACACSSRIRVQKPSECQGSRIGRY